MKLAKSRRLRKNKNKRNKLRTRRQRGSGGCFGGFCSTNNPAVNEAAHGVNESPGDRRYREMLDLTMQMVENNDLGLEQLQLENKQNDGSITPKEQARLIALRSTKRAREIRSNQINNRLQVLNDEVERMRVMLTTRTM